MSEAYGIWLEQRDRWFMVSCDDVLTVLVYNHPGPAIAHARFENEEADCDRCKAARFNKDGTPDFNL